MLSFVLLWKRKLMCAYEFMCIDCLGEDPWETSQLGRGARGHVMGTFTLYLFVVFCKVFLTRYMLYPFKKLVINCYCVLKPGYWNHTIGFHSPLRFSLAPGNCTDYLFSQCPIFTTWEMGTMMLSKLLPQLKNTEELHRCLQCGFTVTLRSSACSDRGWPP